VPYSRPMDVTVVGAGRVGTALAVLLSRAGHRVVGVAGRRGTKERATRHLPGVPVLPAAEAVTLAEIVLIGVPDDRIAGVASDLVAHGAVRAGQTVAHLSGATGLMALAAARDAGARVLSLHPLQTFPDVDAAIVRVPGSAMAVTAEDEPGFELGERLARDVGARPFRLPDPARPLYHAAAVFASNYLVAVIGEAEALFRAAGIPEPLELFLPLSRASLDHAGTLGPARAITGPAARGDAGTVRKNVTALAESAPEAVAAYVALADLATDLARREGRLQEDEARRVREALDPWR
jgi:predicted short-subunit dehydrogenase-like oxidoreductase (DUF2520 family)